MSCAAKLGGPAMKGCSGSPNRFRLRNKVRSVTEEQERVRLVLAVLEQRQAGLLILRSDGLSYQELATALNLNAVSIGTLLSRAQHAFRKEYSKRYGKELG
jgi:RNA polymerase sigma-70 factor (ECF subfamily)